MIPWVAQGRLLAYRVTDASLPPPPEERPVERTRQKPLKLFARRGIAALGGLVGLEAEGLEGERDLVYCDSRVGPTAGRPPCRHAGAMLRGVQGCEP